ncbi:riboflavin synthase [bacterium]|nr:riboflavin synthase [bacterium]
MFTGLIRQNGILRERSGKTIRIDCDMARLQPAHGDSVAVNGACLTVVRMHEDGFGADLLDETLELTTLGRLETGSRLNLEPALRFGDSLGGHLLSGHVEGMGQVVRKVSRNDGDCELSVSIPHALNIYAIHKGSIAIDGVSLTIHELEDHAVVLELIPETLAATNLGGLSEGDKVNLEMDMMVKTVQHSVERILAAMNKD